MRPGWWVGDRDPQAVEPDRGRVAERDRGDPAVEGVGGGEHAEEQGQVGDGAGDRAELGARVAEGADRALVVEHAGDRDQPGGRLEGGDAAEVGGNAQAPARVGAQAAWREGGSHRRGLAAAAAARGPGRVVGVGGAAVDRVVGLQAGPPGRAVGLAEQDRPGRPHPGHRGGVGSRDGGGPLRHPDRGDHAPGLQVVLGGEGHPVQRAGVVAPGQGDVGCRGPLDGVRGDLDDRVEPGVHLLQPVQVGGQHLGRRHLAGADKLRQPGRRQRGQAVHVAGCVRGRPRGRGRSGRRRGGRRWRSRGRSGRR